MAVLFCELKWSTQHYFVLTQRLDSGNTANGSQYRHHTSTINTNPETGTVSKTIAPNGVIQLMAPHIVSGRFTRMTQVSWSSLFIQHKPI
jgi:hypothetical protein